MKYLIKCHVCSERAILNYDGECEPCEKKREKRESRKKSRILERRESRKISRILKRQKIEDFT